jgi:molybdate transport system regulatory protein
MSRTAADHTPASGALALSLRLRKDERNLLGPGKIALLGAIESAGSISGAARTLGMSYRRAWLLVEALNAGFKSPLVAASHGGRQGGGAALTENGARVLALFRALERKAAKASLRERRELARLLSD